jgi:Tfp pilus assembly protein PilP
MKIKNIFFYFVLISVLYSLSTDTSAVMKKAKLEQQPYSRMLYVGSIKVNNAWVACILLPDNTMIHAKVNDYIGVNQATISRISQDSIEVTELVSVNKGDWAESKMLWPLAKSSKHNFSCK